MRRGVFPGSLGETAERLAVDLSLLPQRGARRSFTTCGANPLRFLGYDPAVPPPRAHSSKKFLPYDIHCIDAPPPSFACGRCHRITSFSRVGPRDGILLVSMLTRGMLHGHEVQKPSWYRDERKRARSRQLNRCRPQARAILKLVLAAILTAASPGS